MLGRVVGVPGLFKSADGMDVPSGLAVTQQAWRRDDGGLAMEASRTIDGASYIKLSVNFIQRRGPRDSTNAQRRLGEVANKDDGTGRG